MAPSRSKKRAAKRKAKSAAGSQVEEKRNVHDRSSTSVGPTERVLIGERRIEDGPLGSGCQDKKDPQQEARQFNESGIGVKEEALPPCSPKPLHDNGIEKTISTVPNNMEPDFSKNYYRECPAYLSRSVGRPPRDPEIHRTLASSLEIGIMDWVREFCVDGPEVLEELSCEEKEGLIKSLTGYCVQQDWGSMVDQLGPDSLAYQALPKILAGAILAKSLWEGVVKDPFFFLSEDCAPVPFDNHPDLFLPSKSQIYNLWRWCTKVNSYDACEWRRSTIFALIETCTALNKNPSLGEHTMRLRDEAMEKMAQTMINQSGPLHRFLKNIKDPKMQERRIGNMRGLYSAAEQLCYGLHTQNDEYHYCPFDSFRIYSPGTSATRKMEPSWVHSGESDEKLEMSRLVLFQFRPAFSFSYGNRYERSNSGNTELLWPASVVLSDQPLAALIF